MEWLLLIVAGAGGLVGARKMGQRRESRRRQHEDLEVVRRMADEDVTVFGEQLRRLDAKAAGRELDGAARQDYQVALDAYESAGFAVPRLEDPDEVTLVTDTLATGRYALACVTARLDGQEVPERRVPCFFNPQHGPSVTDVVWTPRRGGTRTVPACAQDAARVAAREKPEVRTVRIGPRTVPYWEAGAASSPYGLGYFPAGGALGSATLAWAFNPMAGHDITAHQPGHASIADSGGSPAGGWDGAGDAGG